MSNPRRRSTVHDLAALRLHTDGSRVLNSDTNLSSRRTKHVARDARGNWIARDAGGLGNVKQRRVVEGEGDDDDETEIDGDEELMEDVEASVRLDKGKGRARDNEEEEEMALSSKSRKKRRFNKDMSYLDSRSPSILPPPSDGEPLPSQPGAASFPVPSSDMLKCIHHFASTYYTAMGQLYDASSEFRKQRKLRQEEKKKAVEGASSSRAPSSDAIDEDEDLRERVPSDDDGSEEEQPEPRGRSTSKGDRKRRVKDLRFMEKDMYRIFDGTALVAIGMLLQEHIAETLQPNVPEGWEKEMVKAERIRKAEERRVKKAGNTRGRRYMVKLEGSQAPGDLESEDEELAHSGEVGGRKTEGEDEWGEEDGEGEDEDEAANG